MKKTVITLAVVVALLIALIGAGLALSPLFLNKYKDRILAKVGETVHRDISLGDIRLTLFTGLGLRLQDVTVSNAKGFRAEPMLSMADLDVKVKFLPLLRGETQVDRIILREPRILIEKDAGGIFNFSDLTSGGKPPVPAAEGKAPGAPAPSIPAALPGLLVSRIEISDGDFAYYDAAFEPLKKGIHIQKLDLMLEDVSLDGPIPFALSFGVNYDAKDIRLSGTVGPVGETLDIEKTPLSLQIAIQDFALDRAMEFLGKEAPVLIRKGTLTATTDVSGDLSSGLTVTGAVNVASLTLSDPAGKETLVQGLDLGLKEDLLVDLKDQKISVRKGALSVDRAKLDLSGQVLNLRKEPSLSFQITSNEIPLSGWDKRFPALVGTGLDGSLKAAGSISGKAAGRMSVVLNLTSPKLVVRLPENKTPAKAEGEKVSWMLFPSAEAASPAKAGKEKPKGPALPENIDMKGRIEVAQGSMDNVPFSDLKANYAKTGNRIDLTNLSVKGFGENGSASGNVHADLGPSSPTYQMDLQASRIDLSKLQGALAARREKVAGELTARLTLKGAGFSTQELEKSLSGDGDFTVENGALTNVNLEEEILTAMAGKFGLPVSTLAEMLGIRISEEKQTPFEEFHGAFRIGSGKIEVQDAVLTSKNHGFSTLGDVGLNQELNLKARMILRQVGEARDKKFTYYLMDDQNRKYIPFKVTGNTSKPKVQVDTDALVKGQAQQVIDKEKEKIKEKLREKLGPGGEEILKPLEKIFKF